MATVQYIRCDHGQWLQDGPCEACDARSTHEGFSIPDHMRERLSELATTADEVASELAWLQKFLARMAQDTDRDNFEYNDGMYRVTAARIRRLAADL